MVNVNYARIKLFPCQACTLQMKTLSFSSGWSKKSKENEDGQTVKVTVKDEVNTTQDKQ